MPPQGHHHYTVTPWRSTADLLRVRNSLYSPVTPQEQSHAIGTVAAWKQRGNVPHAVESTALLMDAMLLHAQFSTSTARADPNLNPDFTSAAGTSMGTASSFALRAAYTTALSRFVTGFADLGRHRTGPGQSMFDVARSIGLPAHFVELRHEVAHEDLPGLARLVRSAREAVNWLWGVYWARLPQGDVDGEVSATVNGPVEANVVSVRQEVAECLKRFRSQRLAALKAKSKTKKEDMVAMSYETQRQCQRLCSGEDEILKWLQLASVLVDDGLIVPSLKQTKGPLADSALQGAYMIWDELLQMLALASPLFAEAFFERAIAHNARLTTSSEQQDRTDPAKWAMYRWTMHLLRSDEWEKAREESDLAFETMALRECVLHPNTQWSHELADEILEDADENVQATWKDVVEASELSDDQDRKAEGGASKEAEKTADVDMEDVSSEPSTQGGWRRETGSWKAVPIGTVAE